MPKWFRKTLLVLVTIATFGMVTPQALLADPSNDDQQDKRDVVEAETSLKDPVIYHNEYISQEELFINQLKQEALVQSHIKFGTRIKPVIEDEFNEVILPNMERVISELTIQYPEEDLSQLTITQSPSGGTSERIFHIMNQQTKKDIVRFHVRRDHRPQEAYAFNFHYHTYLDKFQTHHDLGIIYWSKDTPPNWMT